MAENTQADIDLRQREIDLKERELRLKENAPKSFLQSPLALSIFGAICAICVQIVVQWYSGREQLSLSELQHSRELKERAEQAKAALGQSDLQYQATLVEKAIEHQDINRVTAKLQ